MIIYESDIAESKREVIEAALGLVPDSILTKATSYAMERSGKDHCIEVHEAGPNEYNPGIITLGSNMNTYVVLHETGHLVDENISYRLCQKVWKQGFAWPTNLSWQKPWWKICRKNYPRIEVPWLKKIMKYEPLTGQREYWAHSFALFFEGRQDDLEGNVVRYFDKLSAAEGF